MNILREKIKKGEKTCGTLVSLTDPALCEIMGIVGYDYIWIDMEHTYMSYKEVLCHLNAARSVGAASVVRLPQNDLTVTKKILEMGPEGIIFPMMRTPEEVREMIGATLGVPCRHFLRWMTAHFGQRSAPSRRHRGLRLQALRPPPPSLPRSARLLADAVRRMWRERWIPLQDFARENE